VDRVGVLIGLFYFLVSITLAAVLGFEVWWVNITEQPVALGYVGIALGAALLMLLPRLPRQVFLACGALAFLLYGTGALLGLPTVLMALIALFGVTLWTDRRTGLWALAASLGALGVAVVLLFLRYGFYLPPLERFLTDRVAIFLFNSSGVVVLTWAVADQIRAARERHTLQQESATHAAEAAAHLEAEQTARGQVEALADRQRIAREMHDIVAHGLSVMIVQADGARFAAAADPSVATAALETISATGRSSLAEMRRLLSVLRDDTAPLPEGPQPGLRDIPGLVATITATGRDVRLAVSGDLDADGADAVGLTAYRIVQESLTNVMKHAGDDATAWVTLTIGADRVVVEVVDDGPDGAIAPMRMASASIGQGGPSGPSGHGLRGMAERVEMVGGHLVTGPDPRGGFRVLATLPRGRAGEVES
jgi:signal transduction histidine kinase